MPIKSSIQKAEVRSPKQSREHEDHRGKLMPHSYTSRALSTSKGLKRKIRSSRLEKNIVTAWQKKCYCVGIPEALQLPLLLRVGNNDLLSQNWYEQWLAFYSALFNLLMNIYKHTLVCAENMDCKIKLFSEKAKK